jgi:ATP-dependent DNA ligase
MLAKPAPLPTRGDWSFEVKWDGFRAIGSTVNGLHVLSGRGRDMAAQLPELKALPRGLSST